MTTEIRLRLSAVQMSVIWPGLDVLVKSYVARRDKKWTLYGCNLRMYPPPAEFDRGLFHPCLMDQIIDLRKRFRPNAQVGGRVQMNAIEVRAAIYAVRVNLGYWRWSRHYRRHLSPEAKVTYQLDAQSFNRLKVRSQRVIGSLERHMKRANRFLAKAASRDAYLALMGDWKAHLRWMHLHIAYFKPSPPVIRSYKARHQQILDDLTQMADRGIRNAGYLPPDRAEVRRMMRLFVRSCRRGREGFFTFQYLLEHKRYFTATRRLAEFVLSRLALKERSKR